MNNGSHTLELNSKYDEQKESIMHWLVFVSTKLKALQESASRWVQLRRSFPASNFADGNIIEAIGGNTSPAPTRPGSVHPPANVGWTLKVKNPVVLDPAKVRARSKAIEETCSGIEGEHLVPLLLDRLARAELAIAKLRR